MTIRQINIDGELARFASDTMRSDEMLEASKRVMAVAREGQWSQAAAYHGRALHALGRLADGFAICEEAWQRADRIDDPLGAALAARIAAGRSLMLYDNVQAEHWCRRELQQRRTRLTPALRYQLSDLLASALVSQGDIPGAQEALAEWERAAANHPMLVWLQGDWDRAMLLLRNEFERTRAAGELLAISDCGSVLGRMARVANQRVEAEAILDDALQASIVAPDLNRQLFIRLELAMTNVDLGQFPRAKEELRHCAEILANGEDWRGHHGTYQYTAALLAAAEHILRYVSSDGRWHVALVRRSARIPEKAGEGFNAAVEVFRRCRAPWEESAALLYWSQSLFAASQIRESFEKYEAAFRIFDRIATPTWKDRIQIELFRFITLDSVGEPITIAEDGLSNVFREEGDYWTIVFDGSMFRLRDTIGMHYIRRLIANPGLDFTALELVATTQKVIDQKGGGRNGRLPARQSRAVRVSQPSDSQARERARLMVTKRIKDVIARIRRVHPEMGRHLATYIRTGYTCSYASNENPTKAWLT